MAEKRDRRWQKQRPSWSLWFGSRSGVPRGSLSGFGVLFCPQTGHPGFHPSKPKTALKSPEPRPAIKPSSAPLSLSRRSPSFSCLHTHNRHPRRPKLLLSQTIITRLPILLHPQSSFPCRSPLSLSLCCLYKIVDNARH
jgi:hypothetical protein